MEKKKVENLYLEFTTINPKHKNLVVEFKAKRQKQLLNILQKNLK
jgi:hypothetical protein